MGAAQRKLAEKIEEKEIARKEEQFENVQQQTTAQKVDEIAKESHKNYPKVTLNEEQQNKLRHRREYDPSKGFSTNELVTHRYNPVNFLPKHLFEQYRRISNVYFTIIVVIAFVPEISPISPWTGLLGLLFVLTASAINEGYLDYKRYKNDKKVNSELFNVIDKDGKFKEVASKDIRVGDLLFIECDKVFPADLVLLASALPEGLCFIETAQLDGETNLKEKRTLDILDGQNVEKKSELSKKNLIGQILKLKGQVQVSMPTTALDSFEGFLQIDNLKKSPAKKNSKKKSGTEYSDIRPKENKLPLTTKQLLFRGAFLKNTKWIVGISVYCGQDTKYALNQSTPYSKFSSLDKKMNRIVGGLFVTQIGLCILACLMSLYWESYHIQNTWYLGPTGTWTPKYEALKNFFVYFVLLSFIIPMSLFVSLEIVKVVQGYFMEHDLEMCTNNDSDENSMKVRNNGLNDELGLVKYIFSDKTGTLTENNMKVRKFSVGGYIYTVDMMKEKLGQEGMGKKEENFKEISEKEAEEEKDVAKELTEEEQKETESKKESSSDKLKDCIHEFMMNMVLCHTVVVDVADDNDDEENSKKEEQDLLKVPEEQLLYKGPSPDEEALLCAARKFGYVLKENKPHGVTIQVEKVQDYETLRVLEFSGERKRMSVIVKTPENKIIMYSKGADQVMMELIKDDDTKEPTQRHLDMFSQDGLRTLVLTRKEISQEEFDSFNEKAKEAETDMEKRQEKLEKIYEEIEKDLELLGCTAIEDKLQEEVPETIEFILKCGIHLWVITGDKQETAINIGRSSNLIPKGAEVLILNSENEQELLNKLNEFKEQTKDEDKTFSFVTDGNTLKLIVKDREARLVFLDLVKNCNSVICSRVTPLVKAQVVRLVKNYNQDVCLAIGDGSNDVSMIQEASIGVGLFGKEGTQAARSADYAIREFRHLKRLLVVHGRYSLVRNSSLIHYSMYKNAAFALGQFWFAYWCAWSGQRLYNDYMMLLFNMVFTAIPTIFIAMFEKDIREDIVMDHPELYRELRTGYLFNYKTAFLWLLTALYHSFILYFVAFMIFQNDAIFTNGHTGGLWALGQITQTFAVVIVLLKLAIETRYWVIPTHIAIWGSIALYFVALFVISSLYKFFPEDYYVFETLASSSVFWFSLPLTLVAGLTMDFSWKFAGRLFFPKAWHILQEQVKHESRNGTNFKFADRESSKKGEPDEKSPLLAKKPEKEVNIQHSSGV